jgi:hypothetical protein
MRLMTATYPRIKAVTPTPGKRVVVEFDNGVAKVYDCTPLLASSAFQPLQDEALFRCVHADPHGYGVVWNDDIDLAESELWIHGEPVEPTRPTSK